MSRLGGAQRIAGSNRFAVAKRAFARRPAATVRLQSAATIAKVGAAILAARSATQVMQKKQTSDSGGGGGGGAPTYSAFKWKRKVKDKSFASLIRNEHVQPSIYVTDQPYSVQGGAGRVASWSFEGTVSPHQDQVAFNTEDLRQCFEIARLGQGGSTSYSNTNSIMLAMEEFKGELNITNMRNSTVKVQLYDIICRADTYGSLPITSTVPHSPEAAWSSGSLRHDLTQNPTHLFTGSNPYTSKLFTQNYKVIRVRTVMMPPGSNHIHFMKFKPHAVISTDKLFVTPGLQGIKGLTCYTMLAASGLPVVSSADLARVTTGSTFLACTMRKKYTFYQLSDSTQQIWANTNMLSTFTGTETVGNLATGNFNIVDITPGT